jgi:class 3 adenylate cyclase
LSEPYRAASSATWPRPTQPAPTDFVSRDGKNRRILEHQSIRAAPDLRERLWARPVPSLGPALTRKIQISLKQVQALRAAVACFLAIAGEIGETKQHIVVHGDAMNTAAGLKQATPDLNRLFLVSADALSQRWPALCAAVRA